MSRKKRANVKSWLQNPPDWFLSLVQGVAIGMIVFGFGLMIFGLMMMATHV